MAARQLRQVVRGGLALDRGTGGHDQFGHLAAFQACGQRIQAQLARADPVQWRQPTLQHVVQAAVAGGGLDRQAVGRGFDHAQLLAVAAAAGAGRAHLGLAEVAALAAVAHTFHRLGQHLGQVAAAVAAALEHVVGHALGALAAHAGQHAQRLDQLLQQR